MITFLVFLTVAIGILIYETRGLVTDVESFLSEQGEETYPPDAPLLERFESEADPYLKGLVQKRLNRFLIIVLALLLVLTLLIVFVFITDSLRTPVTDDETSPETLAALRALDDLMDEYEEGSDGLVEDDVLESLRRIGDVEAETANDPGVRDVLAEHLEEMEDNTSGALAHSYTKMVEALQKINDLEKKHSIELALANEKLEKEIAERERAEREIRHLSRRLISGSEEAQKKLAQDLHDEFGQTLAALHMGVENLWNSIPADMTPQKESIDELIGLIEDLGDRIRSISSDLRPDLLDDLGLVPTLEWYITEFNEQRSDIHVEFQAVGFKKRLSSEIELILYRIFQESLNNVVKHARADHVDTILTYNYPKAILLVKDNGVGFDTGERFSGIGLIGMRERAVSVGGTIDIRSEKEKGTSIRVELPV